MNTATMHPDFVKAEIESRYGRWITPRTRPDSSLEILRRTMRRNARKELYPDAR